MFDDLTSLLFPQLSLRIYKTKCSLSAILCNHGDPWAERRGNILTEVSSNIQNIAKRCIGRDKKKM